MKRLTVPFLAALVFRIVLAGTASAASPGELELNGWRPFSPRDEIRPRFAINPTGGPDGQGGLVIQHDGRDGLDGAWTRVFEIEGDSHYRITAQCKIVDVADPRHHVYVELLFHDADGELVLNRRTRVPSRPFYPPDVEADQGGWRKYSGIYRAPAAATHATVKLHLRWEPRGRVEWGGVSLVKSGPRPPRKVRLAAANYRPRDGKTALDNLRQLEPVLAKHAAALAPRPADPGHTPSP